MNQENFTTDTFDQPFIQKMPSGPTLEEKRLKRGEFLIKLMIGFSVFITLCSMYLTGKFFWPAVQIGLHLLLFRGFRWVRILLGLGYASNTLLFYAIYKIIAAHIGFAFGLIVLPFVICNILAVFFLFFNESINYFLENQRDLYR